MKPAFIRQDGLIVTTLALLAIFPPLATDMYLAAFGDIADALHVSDAAVELSLSLFFFGLCIGQLITGPAVDRYGRKLPLLAGVAAFVICSAALLMTSDIVVFNGLRFLQAVGACAGMVVGRAMVTDLFTGRQAAKRMTVLVTLMTLGPVVAPFLGSVVLTAFGWRSIFILMLVIGLVSLLLSATILPETLPASQRSKTSLGRTVGTYLDLARSCDFLVPTLATALTQAAMFSFITASSGVFKSVYGLDNLHYGIAFGVIATGMMVFSYINSQLLDHFSPEELVRIGLPCFVCFAVLLAMVSKVDTLWIFMVPLWASIGCVGLLSSNFMSIAMEAAKGRSGIGSALMGGLQFGIAFLASSIVAVLPGEGAMPLTFGILVPAVLACAIWYLEAVRLRKKQV